jgi:alpha-1,3/alpha-1,6-mannosyltransferase
MASWLSWVIWKNEKKKKLCSFLAGVFHDTFKSLSILPEVLYPSLNFSQFDLQDQDSDQDREKDDSFVFLSINRYERKKNLPLALEAFSKSTFSFN